MAVRVPEAKAWTGQKLSLMVELRARGSFGGSASFSLPQLPGAVLMKVGGTVVSSAEMEGESWFVQTHEFALFSQRTGALEIPAFPVRFGAREGFTGPIKDITASVPAMRVEIQRPLGTEDVGFLITTESLDVSESWEPPPAACEVGEIFKRRIVQRANDMTGMALVPAPLTAPDGIRIYPPQVETSDQTERGAFTGERREIITYLIEKPGTMTLPEIRYVWWNPKAQQLETKTLPATTIEVSPVAISLTAMEDTGRNAWWISAAFVAALALGAVTQHARIRAALRRFHDWRHDPERLACVRLKTAASANDAAAAYTALQDWLRACPAHGLTGATVQAELQSPVGTPLRDEWTALEGLLYAKDVTPAWQGAALSQAFAATRQHLRSPAVRAQKKSTLPPLNP